MAHAYTDIGGLGDFEVEVSNPSGTIVRFTLSDDINRITSIRLVRALICKAITDWLADNRDNLDGNGDTAVLGATDYHPGNGFAAFTWNFGSKYAQVTLTAITYVTVSDTITVSIPYGDVV